MKQVTIINKVIPAESRSKYGTSGRSSVISGGASVDLSPYLLKAIWERNFEERKDEAGNEYIYIKKPIVGAAGLTLFAGEQLKVDSIFKGLPLDTQTLQWVDGVLTVVGGTGGASNWDELEGKPSWITPEKPKYTWSEIEQKPSWITSEKPKYSYTEITGLTEELEKYVTLSTDQSITGMKDFTDGMKVSGVLFKVINGVLTLDCSIAVTGGITTHAIGEQTTATIMDGIAVDGTTITKENGVLKVVGGGGASNWDELEGKPSWITDIKPVYTWGEITQKPTTLSGYGIQASDVLNTIKSVDGSGSGLDADTLDGIHANRLFTSLESDTTANLSITIGGTTKSIIDLCANNATKLQTARTIWGQSFDGTANVTGSLTSVTDITGTGTFTGANIKAIDSVYVNGIRLHKTVDGAVTIEGNLLVTGGITAYADGEDSGGTGGGVIVIDNLTSTLTDAALSANQGRVLKDLIDSKVSNWGELEGKPTTITGYGISASDVLETLKTVDGSGSGLDADTLDGVHNGFVSGRLHTYSLPYTDSDKKNYWVKIATLKLTSQYSSQEAILLISERYTLTSNSYYAFVSVRIQQQNSMGNIPNVSLKAFGSISNSNIVGILNYNSSSSTLDVYYREVDVYQRGYVSYIQGTSDIRTNSQELIATLPSGTQIVSTNDCRCGYSDNADKLDGVQLNGIFTAFTTNGNNTRLTIGGVTKDLTVPYASNADMLDGVHNGSLTAAVLASQGNKTAISGTDLPNSGVRLYQVYNNGYPEKYGNLLSIKGGGCGELLLAWKNTNRIYYRSRSDVFTEVWQEWSTVAFLSDNVASATKLQTARTIWGQSFNGTANVSGNMTGVGSISASGSISCGSLRTTEATINGALTVPYYGDQWISMATRTNIMQANQNQSQSRAHALFRVKSYSGNAVCFGGLNDEVGFYGFYKSRIDSGSNDTDWYTKWNTSNGTLAHKGNLLVTGGGTFYSSDIRAKNVIESLKIKLNDIANAPVIKFRWNGYNGLKDDNKLHVGGVAQYIEKILPECVIGQKDDFLSFDYATTGYVFSVLTARHLLSYETRTDRIIRKLKERIRRLERQLNIENHEEVCIVAD